MAAVVALESPVGFSYPQGLESLLDGVGGQGLDRDRFLSLLWTAVDASTDIWQGEPTEGKSPLSLVLLASPAPAGTGRRSRIAHLAGWTIEPEDLRDFVDLQDEPVEWIHVWDQRPRVTLRRDHARPTQWLAGKRVMILGCGALGAPVAEFCVRAGVAEIYLVDPGLVHPGLLVRQPYLHRDIGEFKVEALAGNLAEIRPEVAIISASIDAVSIVTAEDPLPQVDLLIDATASRRVATALEKSRWVSGRDHPPLLSVMVGHRCELAAATIALPGASGAGADILRRLAVTAADDVALHDLLDDFHPALPRTQLFQPEPGCSDPTYAGSAADLASFGGILLNDALAVLEAAPGEAAAPRMWATVARSPAAVGPGAPAQRLHWPNDILAEDTEHGYQIRMTPSALIAMRREVIHAGAEHGFKAETGGLLLDD